MNQRNLPVLLASEQLAALASDPDTGSKIKIIYAGNKEKFTEAHIPHSIHIAPGALSLGVKPVSGYLPPRQELQNTLRALGVENHHHIVCYDDDAGVSAARLFWLLEAMGHKTVSYLDGGMMAWKQQGYPTATGSAEITNAGHWTAQPDPNVLATKQEVFAAIGDSANNILDARTIEEHRGEKSASARCGRIPGSVHLDWRETRDTGNSNRLKPEEQLREMLISRGITPDKGVIAHCQTHHRSSHSYMMLRAMGYPVVSGYAGSWSEWAADKSLPLESDET